MTEKHEIALYNCWPAERMQALEAYVNGINKKVPFIMFSRGSVYPSFSIPSEELKTAVRLGFEPRAIRIYENGEKTIVTIHAFNREHDEAADFCYVID